MKKIMPIMILMMIILAAVALADINITLDDQGLLPSGVYKSSTIRYNFIVDTNITSGDTIDTCDVWDNSSGTWTKSITLTNVANGTNINVTPQTISDSPIGGYKWNVQCNDTKALPSGVGNWSIANYSYYVDTVVPSIVFNNFTDSANWITSNLSVSINVTDVNPGQCRYMTTLNNTDYSAGTYGNRNTSDYANNTAYSPWKAGQVKYADNNTGVYYLSIVCNDSAGNVASSENKTVFVDSVAPSNFLFNQSEWMTDNLRSLYNNSISSDYTPQIGWNLSNDLNFSRYFIAFCTGGKLSGTTCINVTVSTMTTLRANMSLLARDTVYSINVTAFDIVGNQRSTTSTNFTYTTNSVNRYLDAEWNIIGNAGANMSLSDILSWTGATTVSIWNGSHEFQSHVSGGSYGSINVTPGEAVLIYVATATNFSDLIENTGNYSSATTILYNKSASDWTLTTNKDYIRKYNYSFREIDNHANVNNSAGQTTANITTFSFHDNVAVEGAKYVSYISNWSINNDTTINFGEPIWMELGIATTPDQTFDWSSINRTSR